jgi:hypothetical protein
MTAAPLLPAGYGALESFVDAWANPSLADRVRRRGDTTPQERQEFYEAIRDMVPTALAALDSKPLAALDERENRLLQLVLSYAHVALAIEIRGDGEAEHARQSRHMVIS